MTRFTLGALAATAGLLLLGWWWERKVQTATPTIAWPRTTTPLPAFEPAVTRWWHPQWQDGTAVCNWWEVKAL